MRLDNAFEQCYWTMLLLLRLLLGNAIAIGNVIGEALSAVGQCYWAMLLLLGMRLRNAIVFDFCICNSIVRSAMA